MKNALTVNFEKNQIVMTRLFAQKCSDTRSEEYAHLQSVRRDYPNFTVVTRQIKKNPNKECYKGLTYEYMMNYIILHTAKEEREKAVEEFEEKILISKCHSNAHRYPTIKKWFLTKYPEVAEFGMSTTEEKTKTQTNKIIDMPQKSEEKKTA